MKLNQVILLGALILPVAISHSATLVQATFTSTGPVAFAPAGVVAHDGTFDIFNVRSAASIELRELAETGSPAPLLSTAPGTANTVVLAGSAMPPIAVGGSATNTFSIDTGNNFISLASMILPSSDYFIGNSNPTAFDISSLLSGVIGTSTTFGFSTGYDAGTEINDFLTSPGGGLVGAPAGMTAPPGGDVLEGGVITAVTGPDPFASFLNAGTFDTSSIDFTGVGDFATLTLTVVPEPSTGLLAGLGMLSFFVRRRR